MKLPTLSDGRKRFVTAKQHAKLVARAKKAGKPLREWLELGGHLERKKL